MKYKLLPAIAGIIFVGSLYASQTLGVPTKQLNPIDTIKTVIVYALGQWDNPEH